VTNNVFYAENGVGIGVCEKHFDNCVILVDAETPEIRYRDLILNPKSGQMIWIEEDLSPVLKIAGMDGKKMSTLSTFEHVHAISLDVDNDELYIAEEDVVVRLNLESLSRPEVAPIRTSFMIYYNCDLYYVPRGHETLRVFTGRGEDKEITTLSGSLFHFAVVPDDFKVNQTNLCGSATCSEVCVITGGIAGVEAQCVCKTCAPVDVVKSEGSTFGWIITVILVLMLLTLVAMFVLMYFRLWPALCDRLDALLGLNAHNNSNISVGFNTADFK